MADWLGITSANLSSFCGGANLDDALDGTGFWDHQIETYDTHWFILDLGETSTITKVRGRSNCSYSPILVNIYVSDDSEVWGDAVVSNISTWHDVDEWQEAETTSKNGRYIKVEITDTQASFHNSIYWGKTTPPFTIFDVYGTAGGGSTAGAMSLNTRFWGT